MYDFERKPTTTMRAGEICYGWGDSEGWVWGKPQEYRMDDPERHMDNPRGVIPWSDDEQDAK